MIKMHFFLIFFQGLFILLFGCLWDQKVRTMIVMFLEKSKEP